MMLSRDEKPVSLKEWASSLCTALQPVAALLDSANKNENYSTSLAAQVENIGDSTKTPSARILQAMRDHDEEYFHFAKRKALEHQEYFHNRELSNERMQFFSQAAEQSIEQQKQIEAEDDISFAEFLQQYYAQR